MDKGPYIKNYIAIILPSVLTLFVIFFLVMPKVRENRSNNENTNNLKVTNFEECLEAGNPAMESYPRKCMNGDETFIEKIESLIEESDAIAIARASEECSNAGVLTENISYNSVSGTWWIDLERNPEAEADGCSPACVVSEQTESAEVNWRCNGALPE